MESEIERLTGENESLKREVERLKEWNRKFYGRVHYYFHLLEEWKAAPQYGDQRRKLTAKLRSLEEQMNRELDRVDRIMENRKTDVPAEIGRPTAVQAEFNFG